MSINGTHLLFYTTQAEQLRAMLRDVLGFKHVDAGHGWLIFQTPPGEVGVHPAENGNEGTHAISFMCDDINKTIAELRSKGIDVDPDPADHGYGIVTVMHLPGGCDVQLYEPRHPIAAAITRPPSPTASARQAVKKAPREKAARPKAAKRPARSAGKTKAPRAKQAGRRR
jgi:hypothetical protein